MKRKSVFLLISYCFILLFTGCGADTGAADALTQSSAAPNASPGVISEMSPEDSATTGVFPENAESQISAEGSSGASIETPDSSGVGSSKTDAPEQVSSVRENTPNCPVNTAPGTITYGNDVTSIDASNTAEGYIMARYTGSCSKVKIIITGPDLYKCTYNLNSSEYQAFPLTSGDGTYSIGIYENIQGTDYSTCYTVSIDAAITDSFSPYLRPSQYVDYDADTQAVALAAELCASAADELECVTLVYDYIIENIGYDYDKANQITSGTLTSYIADIDGTLASGKGICLDYAAIMTCMLRSQNIPTRLEVGYAGTAYHAWISTYIKDVGWVNGVVQFDGINWSLMDPTFGASSGEAELRDFIGDGTNYTVKYIY